MPCAGACSSAQKRKEDPVLSNSAQTAKDTAVKDAQVALHPQKAGGDDLLQAVLSSLSEEKAEDIVQIDLRGKSQIADFMVIASGRSSRQVAAMSEKLTEKIKRDLGVISKVEGKSAGDWVLIDAGDVIIHLFRPEVRDFYQLEKMWVSPGEAPSRDA